MIELLYRKKSSIIDVLGVASIVYHQLEEEGLPIEFSEYEQDMVYDINSKTGNQSNELYEGINRMLIQYFGSLLNYEACKKEIERIRKEMTQSEDISVLLTGI